VGLSIAVMAARVVLGLVFALAGSTKLAQRAGSHQMLVAFGVPARIAPGLAAALPAIEIMVAAGLMIPVSAWFAGIAAGTLLLSFSVAIAVNLARGHRPTCNCFGQIRAAPIGIGTLVRNIILVALAALIVSVGPLDAGAWRLGDIVGASGAEDLAALFAVSSLVLLSAVAALLLQMLRQQGRLLLRLDALEGALAHTGVTVPGAPDAATAGIGLPIGSAAPDFRLATPEGSFVKLGDLTSAGKPVLLLFTNPECGPCAALAPEIDVWQAEYSETLDIVRVSEGTAKENKGSARVLLQVKREVADAYQCWGTPGAVLVQPEGMIGSWVAQGADAVRSLITRSAHDAVAQQRRYDVARRPPIRRRTGLGIGEKPPPMLLQDQNDRSIVLDSFLGRNVLLLFWNPDCGFCQSMLEALSAWDAAPPPGAPTLIVVSAASSEINRSMGLSSSVVFDEKGRLGAVFGAHGTPMGVLLDAEGRVASGVVAGAAAVMAFAGVASQVEEAAASA
jgi:thiol-disulfide isomerase/thioredoxin/uncharacterized membrane protein YphA (DoxX/SURF4 family)